MYEHQLTKGNDTSTQACSEWVYDEHVFKSTFAMKVISNNL